MRRPVDYSVGMRWFSVNVDRKVDDVVVCDFRNKGIQERLRGLGFQLQCELDGFCRI